MEGKLGKIMGKVRRALSVVIVRSNPICLPLTDLSRISPPQTHKYLPPNLIIQSQTELHFKIFKKNVVFSRKPNIRNSVELTLIYLFVAVIEKSN